MHKSGKKFWQFRNLANEPGSAELLLYGDIAERSWYGDEASPRQFAEDLAALGAVRSITVRINSAGGDVFAAQSIGNQLEQCGAEVTAHIDALCASAATIVACHCDKVVAANDSTYMIHPVRVGVFDYVNAAELQECLKALAAMQENITALYAKKTGRTKDEVTAWMDETNWWTAEQAKANGFVDELVDDGEETVVENRSGVLFVNSVSAGIDFETAPDYIKNRLSAKPANGLNNTPPAEQPEHESHEEGEKMELNTTDDLRRECPELVNQIERAAQQTAQTEALNTERTRLREIDEVAELFSAELVNEAKYGEHPCNAQELAYRAAVAAKKQGRAFLNAMEADVKNSGLAGVPNAEPPQKVNEKDPAAIRAAAKADAAAYNKMRIKEGK